MVPRFGVSMTIKSILVGYFAVAGFETAFATNWFGDFFVKYLRKDAVVNVPVAVLAGNLTRLTVDAYVVPHFKKGVSTGGVGSAIIEGGAKAGIDSFEQVYAEAGGELPFGSAHVTESGGGNAKYLINVVSVGSGVQNEFKVISDATYNAMVVAHQKGIKTIALPALGTGFAGDSSGRQCADAMLSGLDRFAREGGRLDGVAFVIYGEKETWNGFNQALDSRSYKKFSDSIGGKTFEQKWSKESEPQGPSLEDQQPRIGPCLRIWRLLVGY